MKHKHAEVPQWRKDMAQAIKDGKVVEGTAHLHWADITDIFSPEDWLNPKNDFTQSLYRIRPEPDEDGTETAFVTKEWVGLTDEEIDTWNITGHESLREFVRAIEAKLKEKNHA
jgi:hypothetical protein